MLKTAIAFGADAVYAGQPRYSLRVRNNDFGKLPSLAEAIDTCHAAQKKLYVVSNVLPHNAKVLTYLADMAPVIALKPDALIMADPGLIDLVRENWPEMPIHLSVQANTVNFAAVRFWQKLGITRVILSRELSLDEIEQIRQECPDMELEVFIHGALCVAHSGRCLLSGYMNHRDSNQGSCTNACRWKYKLHENRPEIASADWQIEERERPGEGMPIEEDEHGTYILNSKDLRAIEYVERLSKIGVNSLKIEGRTKSAYYVARTVQAYRRALEDVRAGRPFDASLLPALEALSNRGYTAGFYQRHAASETQNYAQGSSEAGGARYVGEIIAWDETRKMAKIDVKNKFAVGDSLEWIHPAGNREFVLEHLENATKQSIVEAPGNGHFVWLALPGQLAEPLIGTMLAQLLVAPPPNSRVSD